jgi:hypothetical protein
MRVEANESFLKYKLEISSSTQQIFDDAI